MPLHQGIDPQNLSSAGWGAVFPVQTPQAVREALAPLLDHRRKQAGRYFREYIGTSGYRPNETTSQFLARHGAAPGSADPEAVPYYLLLVGDPEAIPYRFQRHLDVQYAVGRVAFDTAEEYANYARAVVRAETEQNRRPVRAVVFAPEHPNDAYTRRLTQQVVHPLLESLRSRTGLEVDAFLGENATKMTLGGTLGFNDAAQVVFVAGHTLGFPAANHTAQARYQGAIVCQGWPGPGKIGTTQPLLSGTFFASDDVPRSDLSGLIVVLHGSFTAGTEPNTGGPGIVAALPQRLLANPAGPALAVVGLIGPCHAAPKTVENPGWRQMQLEGLLGYILDGSPVGYAMELTGASYASFATELHGQLMEVRHGKPDNNKLAELYTAMAEARGYVVLGDPAVRFVPVDRGPSPAPPDGFGGSVTAELNLAFTGLEPGEYRLEARYTDATGTVTVSAQVRFDFDRLHKMELEPERYEAELRTMSLASEAIRPLIERAKQSVPHCRVRLIIPSTDRGLHGLRWELLFPDGVREIAASEPPHSQAPRHEFRAVVAVASPADVGRYRLAPIDVAREVGVVKSGLGDVNVQTVGPPLSIARLFQALELPSDLLYLLCHAFPVEGTTHLFLANETDETTPVAVDEFASRFQRLAEKPRVVILAAVDSFPLAPLLIEGGSTAVVAFQEGTSLSTVTDFTTTFLRALLAGQQPDQAAASGRGHLRTRGRPDWWAPILFTVRGVKR